MIQLLFLHKETDLLVEVQLKGRFLEEAKRVYKGKGSLNNKLSANNQTVLQCLHTNNGECAKARLSTAISTNGKENFDKDLLFILLWFRLVSIFYLSHAGL